jgi:predicted ATP-dependent protease
VGEYEFGHPTRVTATVSAGGGELLNIDRESKLSGPIHDKGFLSLAGFLRDRYAREVPLSLNASLVFEQSYDQMEGDSAATAELLALLSALADVPLRQDVAITGSVNQHGQIQPVGAVNAKVEGFYEVCRQHGLTGEQGVLIPATNVRHLMLKPAVVEAVRAGRFHVFAVATIEEALALLAGRDAGERGPDGSFPPDSVNRLIDDRLRGMAEAARRFLGGSGPDGAAAEPAHTSSTTLARQPSSTRSNSSR